MADIIKTLADTPLPTLLVIIGFMMLSVGFGLRVRVVFDVDRINKSYAKAIGIVLLLVGLVPYISNLVSNVSSHPEETRDPFFIYYLVSVPVVVGLYWAMLKITKGSMQLRAAKWSFMLVGTLVTFVVIWRGMDVYFYINAPGRYAIPLGLFERYDYVPYFALIGAGVAASLLAIYANTKDPENSENRFPIFSAFIVSSIYLAGCRLAWEIVDYLAKARIPLP